MHKKIIILMIFICLFYSACYVEYEYIDDDGYSGTFGDFKWYFQDGKMVIYEYIGEGGDVTVPPIIEGMPVEIIGYNAFRDCETLESVILPNSITDIGLNSFYGCVNLKNINIPNSVITIGGRAFSWCWNLKSINIPDGVIYIFDYAFSNSGLTDITIPDSVIFIGANAFSYSELANITIPKNVTTIGDGAFSGCRNLNAINVNSGNKKYSSDDGILYSKDTKTLIVYPKSREGSVIIKEGVTDIYNGAFNYCQKLESITIPDSVTYIGNIVFSSCRTLKTINVSPGNTNYSSKDGMLFNKDFSTLIVCPNGKIGAVDIPAEVKRIQSAAFTLCIGLTDITIPEGVTVIEWNTFSSCTGLVSITIPDSVTSIGNGAFWRCTDLTKITIPENVTSIEDNAFLVCDSLASVTFKGDKIPLKSFSSFSFNGNLREKYISGGIGTYIRLNAGYTWTKEE